jgi:hypothetical protein
MTDLEILTLIDRYIVQLVEQDATKFKREIGVLLKLKNAISARIGKSLDAQAELTR